MKYYAEVGKFNLSQLNGDRLKSENFSIHRFCLNLALGNPNNYLIYTYRLLVITLTIVESVC